MSAHRIVAFLALLLLTSAFVRGVKVYRDMKSGALDLDNIIACRFGLSSGGMFLIIASALP